MCVQLFEWPCAEEVEGLFDGAAPQLQRLLQFARTVPGKTDQNKGPSGSIICALFTINLDKAEI